MPTTETSASARQRAHRRRIVANGRFQFIADLPRDDVVFLDQIKERQGLRSRGQVLEQLIELRRSVTEQ